MVTNTDIQWADMVWNPVTGCTKVSAGCKNCYAETMANRFKNLYPEGFGKVTCHEDRLEKMLRKRKSGRVFVNSMSDLFHEAVPFAFIDKVFAVMALKPEFTFMILTKRPERMREYLSASGRHPEIASIAGCLVEDGDHAVDYVNDLQWPLKNVWLGVSVEDQKAADQRIPILVDTPAAVRFASYEPALGAVDFGSIINCATCGGAGYYGGGSNMETGEGDIGYPCECTNGGQTAPHSLIDWIIVGGESGAHARPFDIQWARDTVRQCKEAGVACFVKQLGSNPHSSSPEPTHEDHGNIGGCPTALERFSDHKGGDMPEWPEDLRVREFPCADSREVK